MTIPKNIKVGGKTYDVKVTDHLDLGRDRCSAEIDYCGLEIRVTPQKPQKMEADLLHELTHAIFDHLGYKEHDEELIDRLAQALHMVVTDNPRLFTAREKG